LAVEPTFATYIIGISYALASAVWTVVPPAVAVVAAILMTGVLAVAALSGKKSVVGEVPGPRPMKVVI